MERHGTRPGAPPPRAGCAGLFISHSAWATPERVDPADADGVALRAVQALEARTRTEHENMLDDTQALADESESLVRLNAERAAEIPP
jgi:hypothetical protein